MTEALAELFGAGAPAGGGGIDGFVEIGFEAEGERGEEIFLAGRDERVGGEAARGQGFAGLLPLHDAELRGHAVGGADGDDADGDIGVVVDAVDNLVDGVVATDRHDGGVAGGDGGARHLGGFAGLGGFGPFAANAELVEARAQLILQAPDLPAAGGWIYNVVIHGWFSVGSPRRPGACCRSRRRRRRNCPWRLAARPWRTWRVLQLV